MVVRQVRSKVVLMTLYFLLKISDRSRGKVSVGMIGSKSCDKVYCVQRQCVWQCLKPCVVDVEHFTETDSDYEGKKVARAEGTFQDHQCDDKQCLENIVPCSKCEEWKSCAENKRYRGDR